MHGYLDVLLDDLGRAVDSVVPTLLYPQRPSDETVEQLEAIALPKGIMVVFYDDMDWHTDAPEILWAATRSDIAVNRISPLPRCLVS